MKLGDVIKLDGIFWFVSRYDPKRSRTADLLGQGGRFVTVPFDHAVEVIANPSQDWPYIATKISAKLGIIESITRPPSVVPLSLYLDWVPSEPSRAGGSLFLNPALGLRHGDYLLIYHRSGRQSGISIPATFGTVSQNKKRVEAKPKPPDRTVYDKLLDDTQLGDDDD